MIAARLLFAFGATLLPVTWLNWVMVSEVADRPADGIRYGVLLGAGSLILAFVLALQGAL